MNADANQNRIPIGRFLGLSGFLALLVFMASCFVQFVSIQVREFRRFPNNEEVVSLVKSGKLRADSAGDILLPKKWEWLTVNGHIYQTYDKRSRLVLLFPTAADTYSVDWGGEKTTKERDIAGYVFCSGPLPPERWFSFPGMSDVTTGDNDEAVHPHWYYVEPFYSQ